MINNKFLFPNRSLCYLGVSSTFLILNGCSQKEVEKPNVVFFLVDDMGWTDLGCYGSSFYETPNIDRLASEGVRFTNAYAACPVCSPTRASIMTGKYPARINTTDWFGAPQPYNADKHWTGKQKLLPASYVDTLSLQEITIAEALKTEGYRTAFVGKWHLGNEGYYPEDQGFEINIGGWERGAPYYRSFDVEKDQWSGESGFFSPYRNPKLPDGPEGEYLTDRLANESIHFIEKNATQPFFLYLSFYTVHNPMHGKPELVEKYRKKAEEMGLFDSVTYITNPSWVGDFPPRGWRNRILQSNIEYAAMVESLDENVGKVIARIKELGIEDNTIIFFMSDNGGLSTAESSPTSNLPLRAGKGWLYEGGIREPMIIKWPDVVPGGEVCEAPVISTDFYPTILEMAGIELMPGQHMDGKSMVPLLKGEQKQIHDALYWHYPHYGNQGGRPGAVIRKDNFKLIKFFEDDHVELYDLKKDISEKRDLSDSLKTITNELQEQLHQWQESVDARFPTSNPAYSRE